MPIASLVFAVDRDASLPIFEQICVAIRAHIRQGDLANGARLPATRALAADLGVARATVVSAYEQLVAEGYLASRKGAGFTVCAIGEADLAMPILGEPEPVRSVSADGKPPGALASGQPDMRMFPHRAWAKCVARLCRSRPEAMLTGCGRQGLPELRQAIADHVRDWRGLLVSPEQVIVTSGATEALEICMYALAQPEDVIGIEDPGFPPISTFARGAGLWIHDLPLDEQGAQVPSGGAAVNLIVLTPSHQYPVGGAMSAGRRQAFLNWARVSNSWLIEDDYDSEFRYAGKPIPAMMGSDHHGRTLYIGSFSKIFSNSLRMGYLIAPDALVPQLLETMRERGQRASAMPQAALADFMARGDFYRHLRRVRRTYAERHRCLIEALRAHFGAFGQVFDHQAGMQVVLQLIPQISDKQIAERAQARGVDVEALSTYCRNVPERNGLILGACLNDEVEQSAALEILLECFRG